MSWAGFCCPAEIIRQREEKQLNSSCVPPVTMLENHFGINLYLCNTGDKEDMLELRFIRENIELVRRKTMLRGIDPVLIDRFSEIDARRLTLLSETEDLKNMRNTVSREIATLKQQGDNTTAEPLIVEMRDVSARIKELDNELATIQERLNDIVMSIPNLCDDSVPEGSDESDNLEVRKWGELPEFSFTPLSHCEIGEQLDILDFETSAKLA